jgi:tetratricopeptide (TPR) repeat protein
MNEHEFWNELGNVYFISGAYEPAIHAYARSIELNRDFGRPYSNMALAFVHIGRYPDAIELYHRSIELLSDDKEKAITWNRLGILYRQVKDYQSALVAYEQADKLDSRGDEEREEASRDVKYPLFVSMPPIDLNTILERPAEPDVFEEAVNEQLQIAEPDLDIDWFDGNFVPPNPVEEASAELHEQEMDLIDEVTASMEEEGWIPLVFEEAIPVSAPFEVVMQPASGPVEESVNTTSTWETNIEEITHEAPAVELAVLNEEPATVAENEGDANAWAETAGYQVSDGLLVHPDELKAGEPVSEPPAGNQWAEMNGYQIISELIAEQEAQNPEGVELGSSELVAEEVFENVSLNIDDFRSDEVPQPVEEVVEATGTELPFELQSVDLNEDVIAGESNVHSTDATQPMEYEQVEYPLVELSPAEIDSIHIDIARFKRIIQINPRNAFAHDTLGGLYKALGQFKDAITSYQLAISLDSTKPSYFYQLGLMYSAEKRHEEARDAFLRVLSMDPGHILANASLGNYYRKLGLNDIAQQHIDIAMQNVYEEENEYNQACLEAICGNTERALELLQVAIDDNPSYINWAQHDPDLEVLRHDQRFHMMVQSYAQSK